MSSRFFSYLNTATAPDQFAIYSNIVVRKLLLNF
jgi:hypothetical protein